MAVTLTSKVKSVTVSSLKGNTLGILELLDGKGYDYVEKITKRNVEEIKEIWSKSDLIMLGCSTYMRVQEEVPIYPTQLNSFREYLEELEGKTIILFGSGNSDFEMFCGSLDYLEEMLKEKNDVRLVYKFEGYPRQSQKIEFKEMVENITNE